MSTTVSAKIPEELKAALDAEGVNISETIREALEAEAQRRRRAALSARASDLSASLEDSPERAELADMIRDDRRDH